MSDKDHLNNLSDVLSHTLANADNIGHLMIVYTEKNSGQIKWVHPAGIGIYDMVGMLEVAKAGFISVNIPFEKNTISKAAE